MNKNKINNLGDMGKFLSESSLESSVLDISNKQENDSELSINIEKLNKEINNNSKDKKEEFNNYKIIYKYEINDELEQYNIDNDDYYDNFYN